LNLTGFIIKNTVGCLPEDKTPADPGSGFGFKIKLIEMDGIVAVIPLKISGHQFCMK
jgi:hypothetical protein